MGSSEKKYNELIKSFLSRPSQTRELKSAVKPIQTHKTTRSNWKEAQNGDSLDSVKGLIPKESAQANVIKLRSESKILSAVESLLTLNANVLGPDGVAVKLNVPDRDPSDPPGSPSTKSVFNRAKHLCGGHDYEFDLDRAKYAGCIIDTITNAALIAESDDRRFYLRRYSNGLLHIVITNQAHEVVGQAYQKECDLLTQYLPKPAQSFNKAHVIYINTNI